MSNSRGFRGGRGSGVTHPLIPAFRRISEFKASTDYKMSFRQLGRKHRRGAPGARHKYQDGSGKLPMYVSLLLWFEG